jgi:hypothetical protein
MGKPSVLEYAFLERGRIVDTFYMPEAESKTGISVVECIMISSIAK